jgi:hypothetical protein
VLLFVLQARRKSCEAAAAAAGKERDAAKVSVSTAS